MAKKKEPKIERNIVLLGFMGCGKTTVGMILAKRLGMNYIDLDSYLENRQGLDINAIFETLGEAAFRDLEHEVVKEVSALKGCVISTGGGVLNRAENAPLLKANGTMVYINTPFAMCYQRIAPSTRPLVVGNSREELSELYKTRRTDYRSVCDIEVGGIAGSRPVVRSILDAMGLTDK